jgi:hypothetical protein
MGLALKPFSNILNPNIYSVPSGNLRINWDHPLSIDLVACYVPGVSYGKNITGLGGDLSPTNAPTTSITQDGAALATNGNHIYLGALAPQWWLARAKQRGASLFWRGVNLATASTGYAGLFGITYDSAQGSPYSVLSLYREDGSTTLHDFQMNNATGGSTQFSNTFNANIIYSAGATAPISDFLYGYVNGVPSNTPSGNICVLNYTATSTILIGGPVLDIGAQAILNHMHNICYFWTRPLSANEHLMLHLDPYCLLQPAEYELPILSASGGFLPAWAQQYNSPVIGTGLY